MTEITDSSDSVDSMEWRLVAENRKSLEFTSDDSSFKVTAEIDAGLVFFEVTKDLCMSDADLTPLELYVTDKDTVFVGETFEILVKVKCDDDVIFLSAVTWLVITTV